jgi:hypothetical protein
MPLHQKPSKEELAANAQKALEEAEALKNNPPTPSEPIPSPSIPVPTPSPSPAIPSPSEPPPSPAPSKEVIKDIAQREKEKLIASAQEAQILHAKNKKLNESLEKALEATDPTEEELQSKFPDWDMMSDFEKKMAHSSLKSEKQMSALSEIVKENKDLEGWVTKVDEFITDPANLAKYTELDGRQDEFKLFATKPTRRNVEFEDIVSAFLYNTKPEPKKKGKMFEVGSGGLNDKGKATGKISVEEARTLRTTNYEKYKELLKSGKIELEF